MGWGKGGKIGERGYLINKFKTISALYISLIAVLSSS